MTHFFKSTEKFYNCILVFWSKKSNFSDSGKVSSSNLQVDQIIWRRLVHVHRLYLQFSLYPVTYRVEWAKDICVLCHPGRNCPDVCPCPWWAPGFTHGPKGLTRRQHKNFSSWKRRPSRQDILSICIFSTPCNISHCLSIICPCQAPGWVLGQGWISQMLCMFPWTCSLQGFPIHWQFYTKPYGWK